MVTHHGVGIDLLACVKCAPQSPESCRHLLQEGLGADEMFLLNGTDKLGRPCLVVTAANTIDAQRTVDECSRCICYALDRACELVRIWSLREDVCRGMTWSARLRPMRYS